MHVLYAREHMSLTSRELMLLELAKANRWYRNLAVSVFHSDERS